MAIANCPRCDKLFDNATTSVCSACVEDEERDEKLVLDALDKNPDLTAQQISESTDVDVEVVVRMIERGSVAVVDHKNPALCGRCGAPAISHTKRVCQKCLIELDQEVTRMRREIESENAGDDMRGDSVHKTIQAKRK